MNYSKIAIRYAKSLFLAALEEQKLNNVYNNLLVLQEVLNENKEFYFFLQTPILSPEEKKNLFKSVFEKKIETLTLNFLLLLVDQHRENRLKDIIRNFFTLYNSHNQIINISIITANKLDESYIFEFKNKLEQFLSKSVQLHNEVDENIVGGFVLQIEDKEYDASIKNQLNKIKNNLIETSMI